MLIRSILGILSSSLCTVVLAQVPNNTIKLGVLSDFSGAFSSWGADGSVLATKMAVEDIKKAHPNFPYEVKIISADFQLRPDVAVAITKKWMSEGVNAIIDIPMSAAALAVNSQLKGSNVAALLSGTASNDLVTKNCSPNMVHWTHDQYSIGGPTARALSEGGKSWFFITQDSLGGKALEEGALPIIEAAGGKVLGRVKNPTGVSDFSSPLVQAQASKADVIALAQGGTDTTNAVKQAQEFGIIDGGQKIALLWSVLPDIYGMGLDTAQGLILTDSFFWNENDRTREFAKRFSDQYKGKAPTSIQAGAYSVALHYLKSVYDSKSVDAPIVVAKMKEIPVEDSVYGKGYVREDGQLIHDMLLVQVKTPSESTGAWDLYNIIKKIPGDEAYRAISKECQLATK